MAITVSAGVVSSGVNLSYNTMYVYGSVVDAVVNAHGSLDIFGGGSAANTVVNSAGYLYVDGGKVDGSVINANGSLVVGEYGSALNTTVKDGAFCEVGNGAYVSGMSISGTGTLTVSNGATVTALSFGSAANVTVLAGGKVQVIFNPWGGTVNAEAGATVEYLASEKAGYVGNSSDGLIEMVSDFSGYTVGSGNSALIYSGFTAGSAIVGNGGTFIVNAGATAAETNVLNGGKLIVSAGAAADGTTVFNGGVMSVDNTIVKNTNISAGGILQLANGAIASSTNLFSGTVLDCSAGAVMSSTFVNAGAELRVSAGAVVGGVDVAENGSLTVYAGASASNVNVTKGATFNVNLTSDTYVKGSYEGVEFEIKSGSVSGCGIFDGFNCIVGSGNLLDTAVVSQGGNLLVSGGSANNVSLIGGEELAVAGVLDNGGISAVTVSSNGYLLVDSANADDVTVNSAGSVIVRKDGVVANATINNGGVVSVSNGGLISGVLVNSMGTLTISAGAIAEEVSVNSFAKLYVLSGGSASIAFSPWQDAVTSQAGAIITYLGTGSGVYVGNGTSGIVSKSDTLSGYTITSGLSANVYVGGIMNDVTVNSKGTVNVYDGGVVSGIEVKGGASVYIDNGGTVFDATVNPKGTVTVSDGALLAGGVVSSGGIVTVLTGGVAENLAVDPMGYLYVSSGGSASILFNPWQNNVIVAEGGILTVVGEGSGIYIGNETQGVTQTDSKLWNVSVDSGMFANVYHGGLAIGFDVNSKGEMNVSAGGVASNTDVNSKGVLNVYESGSAYLTNVNSGGSLNVSNGGYTYATNVEQGASVAIFDGAKVSNTTLRGSAKVSSGGSFIDATVYGGAVIDIFEGGSIGGSINVTGAANINVASGANTGANNAANQKITLSSGAVMSVASGGSIKNTAVSSGAAANLALKATAENTEVFSGASMTALDCNLSNTTIHSGANVNGFVAQRKTNSEQGLNIVDAYVGENARAYLYNNQSANYAVVDPNGMMFVNYGGYASNTHINSDGVVYVKSNGKVEHTTIHSGGYMVVSKGGVADNVEARLTAALQVQESGTASNVVLGAASSYIVSTGLTSGLLVNVPGGVLFASSGYNLKNIYASTGAVVNGLVIAEFAGGYQIVGNTEGKYGDFDIHMNNTIAATKSAYIYANQTANSVEVKGGGAVNILNGSSGTAQGSATTVSVVSNGYVNVSGGAAGKVTLNTSMGVQYMTWKVKAGDKEVTKGSAWLAPTSANYDYWYVYDSTPGAQTATLVSVYLGPGGAAEAMQYINAGLNYERGEKIERVLVADGDDGYAAKTYITSGGIVSSMVADAYSEVHVSSGGVLHNTTIKGYLYESAGFGVMYKDPSYKDIDWGYAGGSLCLSSGAVHSGYLRYETQWYTGTNGGEMLYDTVNQAVWADGVDCHGAKVVVEKGAVLDFTVAEMSVYSNSNNIALVTDLGSFENVIDLQYTITVKENQATGNYFLASNMPDISRIYASIGNGEVEYGVVISEGAEITYQNRTYQLKVYDIDRVDERQAHFDTTRKTDDLVLVVKESGNFAPVINGIVQEISENGRAVTLTIDATDPDNDAMVYEYKIDDGAWVTMDGVTLTVSDNCTVSFRVTDAAHYVITTSAEVTAIEKYQTSDLLGNGYSQILAYDEAKGKVGMVDPGVESGSKWKGVWEWSGKNIELWEVAGTGYFKGSQAGHDGILLYNRKGHTFAVWSDITKGSYGYFELGHVDDNFSTVAVANVDGDIYDDVLIRDDQGNFGVMLGGVTYRDICNGNSAWELLGAASTASGKDQLIVLNTFNNHLYAWNDQDGDFSTWDWKTTDLGALEEGWEFSVTGDFSGDGIDDVVILNTENGELWLWENGDNTNKRWIGTLNAAESWGDVTGVGDANGWEVAGVGDYNDDGKEDLLLRECVTGWGGLGYWGAGYAGNWVDLRARVENNENSNFAIIA